MFVAHLMLGISSSHTSEVDANARLITAAPNLLTACKRAAGVLSGGDMTKQGLIDALEAIRSAIAKAEGRAALASSNDTGQGDK
jgi:hypothetical protein